jgi:tRNA(Glu) U13 pseudouridine synthase TruD
LSFSGLITRRFVRKKQQKKANRLPHQANPEKNTWNITCQVTLLIETSWNNLKTSSQQRLKDRYPQAYQTIHANSFVQSLFPQLNRYMTEDENFIKSLDKS